VERERLRRQANNARERFVVLLSVNIETNNARERFVVLLSVNIETNNARERFIVLLSVNIETNNARERFVVLLSVNIEANNARERFIVLLSVNIEANNAREVCCPAVCKPTLFSKRLPIFEKLTSHNFFFFNLTPGLFQILLQSCQTNFQHIYQQCKPS
jgi:hypothetical protein